MAKWKRNFCAEFLCGVLTPVCPKYIEICSGKRRGYTCGVAYYAHLLVVFLRVFLCSLLLTNEIIHDKELIPFFFVDDLVIDFIYYTFVCGFQLLKQFTKVEYFYDKTTLTYTQNLSHLPLCF